MTETSTDALPDRLSLDPRSPFHDAALLERGVGIRFNGVERTNVEEYCVSEGWIKVAAGKARDRRGQPMTMKMRGKVAPYLQLADAAPGDAAAE
jgi:site-specific recombinase XerC